MATDTIANRTKKQHWLILITTCFLFFMAGNSIFNLTYPDEVFYTQTAKEMMERHEWLTPYLFDAPQFEKPILLYWMLRLSFLPAGVSPEAARFFPALFAFIGICAIYYFGTIGFKNNRKAFLASMVMASSALYIGLARTVFTDMMFSVFILLSLLSFYAGFEKEKKRSSSIMLFFVFSAFAVLTKGPLGFIIPAAIVFLFLLLQKKQVFSIKSQGTLIGLLLFVAISAPWYAYVISKYGNTFIQEFFVNDHYRRLIEAEHPSNDYILYYPLCMIGCMFPWCFFVIASAWALIRSTSRNMHPMRMLILIWLLVVLCIFGVAHSKLPSYIVPLFPAMALMIGDFLEEQESKDKPSRFFLFASWASVILALLLPIALTIGRTHKALASYITPSINTTITYTIAALFLIVATGMTVLIRKKYKMLTMILMFVMPVILAAGASQHLTLNKYLSSSDVCSILTNKYNPQGTILCSKALSRGVFYYTRNKVACLSLKGRPYFSPHPIQMITTNESLFDFLKTQPTVYCILLRKDADSIAEIKNPSLSFEILEICGNQCVCKISYKKPSDAPPQI